MGTGYLTGWIISLQCIAKLLRNWTPCKEAGYPRACIHGNTVGKENADLHRAVKVNKIHPEINKGVGILISRKEVWAVGCELNFLLNWFWAWVFIFFILNQIWICIFTLYFCFFLNWSFPVNHCSQCPLGGAKLPSVSYSVAVNSAGAATDALSKWALSVFPKLWLDYGYPP